MMGSPKNEIGRSPDEGDIKDKPVEVIFSKSFAIMTTEVTQRQWFDVMGENPSYFKKQTYCAKYHHTIQTQKEEVLLCPNHPVERVSWYDVQKYIKQLNKLQGREDCHGTPWDKAGCFRLPTEAEWEFAARGGTLSAYSFEMILPF